MVHKILNKIRDVDRHYKLIGRKAFRFIWQRDIKKDADLSILPEGIRYPIHLRNHTTDVEMFYYIFEKLELNVTFDFQPKVIIDGGAHIGLSAIFFANKFPTATIYSLEPEISNFEMLKRNTASYPNIICLNKGLWNDSAPLEVIDNNYGNWGFMTKEASTRSNNTIDAISIPALMEQFNFQQIDICKLNIEGSEKELFDKNYEAWLPHTKALIIELHDNMRPGCSKSFLSAIGTDRFSLYPSGSYIVCRRLM